MRRTLPDLTCPTCGDRLPPGHGEAVAPATWSECLRRCDRCEVGFSNARDSPTTLFRDPLMNVPGQVRDGVLDTLSLALNERNRPNKRGKFGFSTSEDALTWTAFKFLQESGQLLGVLRRSGLAVPDRASRPQAMLLWGVPIPLDRPGNERGWLLRERLEAISDRLGEDPRSRTEPDVVIDLGPDGVVIFEVKHRSPTDVKSECHGGWDRYYPASSLLPYAGAVRASGCYELARNWRFGLELASAPCRPFTLACLGPELLFRGPGAEALRPFEACLPGEGPARFLKVSWDVLLGAIEGAPGWLADYVGVRGYTNAKEGR